MNTVIDAFVGALCTGTTATVDPCDNGDAAIYAPDGRVFYYDAANVGITYGTNNTFAIDDIVDGRPV